MVFGFKLHRNIPLLFLIRICRAFCINLIWTTWPLFVQSFGASVYQTTLVWSFGGIANVLLAIPFSLLSDRFGRKIAIYLSLSFTIVSHFAYTFVTSWKLLIPFKMMADVAWILYMPAEAAMIADISVPSTRGRMYGIVGVAHPIGSIVAPLVGGLILDNYGWNAVFYGIVFSGAVAVILAFFLFETRKRKKKTELKKMESNGASLKNFKTRIDPSFLYPMLIFVFFNFFNGIQMGLSQITPIYLVERFNASSFQQGLFFSVGTMVPNLVIQFFGGWLADKYSRRKLILTSIAFFPLFMVFWPSMDSYPNLLLLRTLITSTMFAGAFSPVFSAYLMDFTDETKRGLSSGISQLGNRLGGTVVGTPLLGHLYEQYGQAVPFYVAALFPLPSIPILMLLKEKKEKLLEK